MKQPEAKRSFVLLGSKPSFSWAPAFGKRLREAATDAGHVSAGNCAGPVLFVKMTPATAKGDLTIQAILRIS